MICNAPLALPTSVAQPPVSAGPPMRHETSRVPAIQLAGHTHGGQLCLPFYGAIITNCDLDRSRAKGASQWGTHTQLHVSAGIGTSPFYPVRFYCRPEVTLLTLVAAPIGGHDAGARESQSYPTVSAR